MVIEALSVRSASFLVSVSAGKRGEDSPWVAVCFCNSTRFAFRGREASRVVMTMLLDLWRARLSCLESVMVGDGGVVV